MAEYIWPTTVVPNSSSVTLTDGAGRFMSPFTGTTRTVSRPGSSRLKMSLKFHALKDEKRGALQAFISRMGGAANRVWCKDHSYTQRGSFPATELFTNNDFSSGTTGWSALRGTLTVSGGVARLTSTKSSGKGSSVAYPSASTTVTQYAPYLMRSNISAGRFNDSSALTGPYIASTAFSIIDGTDYVSGGGHLSVWGVSSSTAVSTTSHIPLVMDADETKLVAGDYAEINWCSLSRCALVDNAPNLLKSSQTMGTDSSPVTWSGTRASVVPNPSPGAVAPDGTSTADAIVEDSTASNTHYIEQSVAVSTAAADYSFSVSLKASQASPQSRGYARIEILDNAGTSYLYATINLLNGVAINAGVAGSNMTNYRTAIVSQGNGWYRLSVTGMKAAGVTTLTSRIYLVSSAGGTYTYSGDGSSLIYAWGASLAQSSVPVKYTATTTAAVAAAAQTGSALNIKGLPASTSGLLLPGDQVQIGEELKIVTASLDSNAAGLGYLQFAPALRASPSDNDPVIIHEPMGKFLLAENENGWESTPGTFSSCEVNLVEAVD